MRCRQSFFFKKKLIYLVIFKKKNHILDTIIYKLFIPGFQWGSKNWDLKKKKKKLLPNFIVLSIKLPFHRENKKPSWRQRFFYLFLLLLFREFKPIVAEIHLWKKKKKNVFQSSTLFRQKSSTKRLPSTHALRNAICFCIPKI